MFEVFFTPTGAAFARIHHWLEPPNEKRLAKPMFEVAVAALPKEQWNQNPTLMVYFCWMLDLAPWFLCKSFQAIRIQERKTNLYSFRMCFCSCSIWLFSQNFPWISLWNWWPISKYHWDKFLNGAACSWCRLRTLLPIPSMYGFIYQHAYHQNQPFIYR